MPEGAEVGRKLWRKVFVLPFFSCNLYIYIYIYIKSHSMKTPSTEDLNICHNSLQLKYFLY